jgi:hypothetical protein
MGGLFRFQVQADNGSKFNADKGFPGQADKRFYTQPDERVPSSQLMIHGLQAICDKRNTLRRQLDNVASKYTQLHDLGV